MKKNLENVAKAYSAVIALLESLLTLPAQPRRLELMRDTMERELALLEAEQPPEDVAA